MSEHYTVSECQALRATREGRAELERAIARACGREPSPWWCATCREAVPESEVTPTLHHRACGWAVVEALHEITPEYLTTAEGAEGYGDRCWEMIGALQKARPNIEFNWEATADSQWEIQFGVGTHDAGLTDTLADALCLALAAARLLKKEAN